MRLALELAKLEMQKGKKVKSDMGTDLVALGARLGVREQP